MRGTSLQDFVCRAMAQNRISFGDLRRLRRDILPDGITTREQAESPCYSINRPRRPYRRKAAGAGELKKS